MKVNLKDILTHINPEIDQETLLLYLQGKLSSEKQHEVEKKLMEGEFESDAIEGLQAVNDKEHIQAIVEQLNHELKKKTKRKKQKLKRTQLKSDPTLWIAIVIILILVVISYLTLHFLMSNR